MQTFTIISSVHICFLLDFCSYSHFLMKSIILLLPTPAHLSNFLRQECTIVPVAWSPGKWGWQSVPSSKISICCRQIKILLKKDLAKHGLGPATPTKLAVACEFPCENNLGNEKQLTQQTILVRKTVCTCEKQEISPIRISEEICKHLNESVLAHTHKTPFYPMSEVARKPLANGSSTRGL